MNKKPLAIIIPTYNRLDCVQYYLETKLSAFRECGIDVIIYDSSDKDDIRQCVQRLCDAGVENLIYRRYDGRLNKKAIDEKVFAACSEFCLEYEYIWLSSDGTVFHIERLWPSICRAMKENVDMIVLNHQNADNALERRYENGRELLHDCGWILTMLGAGIVSGEVVREAVKHVPISGRDNFLLWHPLAYFYVFAERPIQALWLGIQNTYEENPYRTDAFWKVNGDALWQWGEVWVQAIESLPACYNEVKEPVLKSWDKYARLFSVKGLMGLRAQGQITFSDVVKYKRYIPKITDTNVGWFYLITLPGNQAVLSWIRKIYRTIKRKRSVSL